MILFWMLLWCSGLIYLAFLIIMATGLLKMPRQPMVEDDDKLPTVSVVVAARNEEHRIGRLLDALAAQDYPREKFEVVVVDDRSEDRTAELVKRQLGSVLRLQIIRVREGENGTGRAPKKYALSRGIQRTRGEIIVTTDADCWMSPRWLRAICSPFVDPEVGGATGVSRFVRPNEQELPWWSDLESVEHLTYSVYAAGCIAAGHVSNAHGSNLAVRRSLYDQVGGYASNEYITSGDDIFMLQDVAALGAKVVFIDRPEGYVLSTPVDSVKDWVNQRARWNSKGIYFPPFLLFMLAGTLAFYTALYLMLPLTLMRRIRGAITFALFFAKVSFETLLFHYGSRRIGEHIPPLRFVLSILLVPPFFVYATIRGQFFSFSWKGNQYSGSNAAHKASQQPSTQRR